MNRELKFRVWDKLVEKYSYPDKGYQGHFFIDLNGIFHNFQNGSGGNECVVQQYTGLKDKNGNPIYEGDVVKYARTKVESTEFVKGCYSSKLIELGEEIGEIIFIMPSFCISFEHIRYDDIMPMCLAEHRYEVIGNIFQNPELLKQ